MRNVIRIIIQFIIIQSVKSDGFTGRNTIDSKRQCPLHRLISTFISELSINLHINHKCILQIVDPSMKLVFSTLLTICSYNPPLSQVTSYF